MPLGGRFKSADCALRATEKRISPQRNILYNAADSLWLAGWLAAAGFCSLLSTAAFCFLLSSHLVHRTSAHSRPLTSNSLHSFKHSTHIHIHNSLQTVSLAPCSCPHSSVHSSLCPPRSLSLLLPASCSVVRAVSRLTLSVASLFQSPLSHQQ